MGEASSSEESSGDVLWGLAGASLSLKKVLFDILNGLVSVAGAGYQIITTITQQPSERSELGD